MPKLKTLSRLLAPVALMALAACQTTQQPGSGTATPSTSAPAAVEPSTPAESMGQTQGQEMAAPLLVFWLIPNRMLIGLRFKLMRAMCCTWSQMLF